MDSLAHGGRNLRPHAARRVSDGRRAIVAVHEVHVGRLRFSSDVKVSADAGRLATALGGGFVLAAACVSRLRNYDVGWFGWDQAYFLAEARRVAAGDFDVTGPLAVGVNVIGPLYSYVLGGLLWIGGDAGFIALGNALLEVAAVALVFVSARRLSGLAGAIAAAVTYASVPVLVLSTRMIWNPSWLPALSVVGWWLVLRYTESPTRSAIFAVGFVAGVAPALHATGVLHSLGWVLVILLSRPPLGWLSLAALAGILPLLPVVARAAAGKLQAAAAQPLVSMRGLNDLSSTLDGIRSLVAAFPLALAADVWPGSWSSHAFHVAGLLSIVGIVRGLRMAGPRRHVWLGIAVTFIIHITAASFYSGYLSWYYFMALVGPMCLGLAHAFPLLGGRATQWAVAVALTGAAVVHLTFVWEFDRRTVEAGYIEVDGRGLALFNEDFVWQQRNVAPAHSVPLRLQRSLAETLRTVVPGGTTAMQVSHGGRAELWRAVGAEYMPADEPQTAQWPWQFVIMGLGARAADQSAFVRGNGTCVFDRIGDPRWSVHEGHVPATWDSPLFDAGTWPSVELPRRPVIRSQAGPNLEQVVWNSPTVRLRGTLEVEAGASAQHLLAVSIQSRTAHSVALSVNGVAIPLRRNRVLASDIFRAEEWLFDLAPQLQSGANLLAVQVTGPSPVFDLDVFRVPCVDTDWYY